MFRRQIYSLAVSILASALFVLPSGADAAPAQITKLATTDISITSAKVSWITDKLTTDNRVEVRAKGSDSTTVYRDDYPAGTYVHLVTVINLKTDTEYEYRVLSEENVWDNGGAWYAFRTFPFNTSTAFPKALTGRVVDKAGQPVSRSIIRITLSRDGETSVPLTVINNAIGSEGSWLADIVLSFSAETKTYFNPSPGDRLIIEYLPNFWTSDTDSLTVGGSFPQTIGEKAIDLFDPSLGTPGDIDGNSKIDIFDLLNMLKVLGGTLVPSSEPRLAVAADVDRNSRYDIFDLLALLRLLSGASV